MSASAALRFVSLAPQRVLNSPTVDRHGLLVAQSVRRLRVRLQLLLRALTPIASPSSARTDAGKLTDAEFARLPRRRTAGSIRKADLCKGADRRASTPT